MPIYRISNPLTGQALKLVAAENRLAVLCHVACNSFHVSACDAEEVASLMQNGVRFERAGDDPQPEPAEPQLIGHTADTTEEISAAQHEQSCCASAETTDQPPQGPPMPIYRISDATTGKPLRLVAADNKATALRHAARNSFAVYACDAVETATLMQQGVPFDRAGDEPAPTTEPAAEGGHSEQE